MSDTINLGDEAKDTVTGFAGIVVGITEWLHGCRRLIVQPTKLHDGKPIEAISFDEPQLELVRSARAKVGSRETGGPRPEPTRHSTPSR